MEAAKRRYDIDWLRVIAIGLLLIYHTTIGFQPWGVFIQFIQNNESLQSLWIPMSMLNVWRIPLLFFVSGMGVAFAIRKRSWKQLLLERTRRIFLPFIFGALCIVPLHMLIWQKYYSQEIQYIPHPGHLWFLGNIFIYVILLLPVFFYLKKNDNGWIVKWIQNLFKTPLGILLIIGFFVLEVLILQPEIFELYVLTPHGFFLGLLAFFFGFICIQSGHSFWQTVLSWRWLFLAGAIALFFLRYFEYELNAPNVLTAIESNLWIFAVFGFAHKHLNRPGKTLQYLSEGAYPIYIIHMIFLFLSSYWIFPMDIPVWLKYVFVLTATFAGCFVIYEWVIRRVHSLRPLFGLRGLRKEDVRPIQVDVKEVKLVNSPKNS